MNSVRSLTQASRTSEKHRITTKEVVLAGMFAAVLTVISQLSVPMPTGVPITIQVFGIALVGVILGSRLGLYTTAVYIILGAVGLPVFSNFHGGLSCLVGLTGGYIWTWPIMAVLCGIKPKTSNKFLNTALIIVFSLLGLAVNEIIGGLQWAALSGDMSVGAVFAYSIVAFIPKDIILTILAVVIGIPLHKLISRQL